MVISLLETVIITNVLHHSSMKYQEVPHWVSVVVLKHIATLICYRSPVELQPTNPVPRDKAQGLASGSVSVPPAASQTSSQKTISNQGMKAAQPQKYLLSINETSECSILKERKHHLSVTC